jgi:hypothetical protein
MNARGGTHGISRVCQMPGCHSVTARQVKILNAATATSNRSVGVFNSCRSQAHRLPLFFSSRASYLPFPRVFLVRPTPLLSPPAWRVTSPAVSDVGMQRSWLVNGRRELRATLKLVKISPAMFCAAARKTVGDEQLRVYLNFVLFAKGID